jgi:hypothetical protein
MHSNFAIGLLHARFNHRVKQAGEKSLALRLHQVAILGGERRGGNPGGTVCHGNHGLDLLRLQGRQ